VLPSRDPRGRFFRSFLHRGWRVILALAARTVARTAVTRGTMNGSAPPASLTRLLSRGVFANHGLQIDSDTGTLLNVE
jgi:hypothetical protein